MNSKFQKFNLVDGANC